MRNETAKKKESTEKLVLLDPDLKSPRAKDFEDKLSSFIVGQERAVRRMSGLFQIYLAGMNNPARPVGTLLFLGPTGSEKRASSKRRHRFCSANRTRSSKLTAPSFNIRTRLPNLSARLRAISDTAKRRRC
jgi:hypothetical protein